MKAVHLTKSYGSLYQAKRRQISEENNQEIKVVLMTSILWSVVYDAILLHSWAFPTAKSKFPSL
jgi:hypothetical protein